MNNEELEKKLQDINNEIKLLSAQVDAIDLRVQRLENTPPSETSEKINEITNMLDELSDILELNNVTNDYPELSFNPDPMLTNMLFMKAPDEPSEEDKFQLWLEKYIEALENMDVKDEDEKAFHFYLLDVQKATAEEILKNYKKFKEEE